MAADWFRPRSEGFPSEWHMRAGETPAGLILAACDRTFRSDDTLEEREPDAIPANERCDVCRDVYAAAERNRI